MEIITANAETKLANIAASIGRDPKSWEGWSCLYIEINGLENSAYEDSVIWTKSIVDSYLNNIEGRVYACNANFIFMICKNVSEKVLKQAGYQICELIFAESSAFSDYKIYNLGTDGYSFAQQVLEHANWCSIPITDSNNKPIYIPSLTPPDIKTKSEHIETDISKVLLIEDDPVTRWMVRNALNHVSSTDGDAWKKAAHKFKGSAANLGAYILSDICFEAEKSPEAPESEKAKILERIIASYNDVQQEMKTKETEAA